MRRGHALWRNALIMAPLETGREPRASGQDDTATETLRDRLLAEPTSVELVFLGSPRLSHRTYRSYTNARETLASDHRWTRVPIAGSRPEDFASLLSAAACRFTVPPFD